MSMHHIGGESASDWGILNPCILRDLGTVNLLAVRVEHKGLASLTVEAAPLRKSASLRTRRGRKKWRVCVSSETGHSLSKTVFFIPQYFLFYQQPPPSCLMLNLRASTAVFLHFLVETVTHLSLLSPHDWDTIPINFSSSSRLPQANLIGPSYFSLEFIHFFSNF